MWSMQEKLDDHKYKLKVCWSFLFLVPLLCRSLFPPRLHGVWHDFSQLQHPAVAHHPLPWERFALRLLAESCSGDVGRLGDGSVNSMRSGTPAHRDLWHRGKTSHRSPGPKEQKHPGHKGVALLHRRPGSVSFTTVILFFGFSDPHCLYTSMFGFRQASPLVAICCMF